SGPGLFNMCSIAERTRKATGIEFGVVGFDSGKGLPPAIDYRDLPEEFQEGDFPMSSFSALMPASIAQARFKPSEIVRAADSTYGSRYLIGPSRVTPDGKEQRYGIASGLLGGFGGFVARSFRDHDFQLGHRKLINTS